MAGYVVYPPQPATHTTAEHCSPGTSILADAIEERWPALLVRSGAYGCYNRRLVSGGHAKSVHGDGRALDIGVGWSPSVEQLAAMAELVWLATAGCYVLGIQRLLYNHHAWDASRGWHRSSSMGGAHVDHLHLEQSRAAAWTRPLQRAVARCAFQLPADPT